MRVIYDKPKGQRIKKGRSKIMWGDKIRKIDNFCGLTHWVRLSEPLLYWSNNDKKWVDSNGYCGKISSHNTDIKNLKQAIRHIKRHDEIPKGTRMVLESRFKGFDIVIIK